MKAQVQIDAKDWQSGYDAGRSGASFRGAPAGVDQHSYAAGFIEGKAARNVKP